MSGWFGFFGPKGMPKDVHRELNGAMVQALADPAVRSASPSSASTSLRASSRRPEGLAAFLKAEIEKWWPIIKAANIKGE